MTGSKSGKLTLGRMWRREKRPTLVLGHGHGMGSMRVIAGFEQLTETDALMG